MTTNETSVQLGSTGNAAAFAVELAVGGMTCSSCAARIEKKLNRLDGVSAAVNYATEQARIQYDPGQRRTGRSRGYHRGHRVHRPLSEPERPGHG